MNINFNIKLLSGNKIVLLELDGFDSEIFVPLIRNNRIVLENVVESRRCCCEKADFNIQPKVTSMITTKYKTKSCARSNSLQFSPLDITRRYIKRRRISPIIGIKNDIFYSPINKLNLNEKNYKKDLNLCESLQENHLNISAELTFNSPLTQIHNLNELGTLYKLPKPDLSAYPIKFSENNVKSPVSKTKSIVKTYSKKKINKIQKETKSPINKNHSKSIDQKFKLVHLYRNQTEDSPKKPVKLLTVPKLQNLKESGNICSHFENSNSTLVFKKQIVKTYIRKEKFVKSPPKTITKWRKCLTPIRTYSRIKNSEQRRNTPKCKLLATPRIVPIEKISLPDYIRNPTNGIDGDSILVIRKKKIVQDAKTNISTKAFKNQLKNEIDLKPNNLYLPKFKKEFINVVYDRPYELLTNLHKQRNISKNLAEMFKSRCVKKVCPTKPNYLKLIGKVPQLEENNCKNDKFGRQHILEPRSLFL